MTNHLEEKSTSSTAKQSVWRSPWLDLGLYLLLAGVPWLFLDLQERLKWSESKELLWPSYTILTIVYMALALAFLLKPEPSELGSNRDWKRIKPVTTRKKTLACIATAIIGMAVLVPSIWHTIKWLTYEPQNVVRADMVPFIELALRDFWRDSHFPYHSYMVGHWYTSSAYMPGLWLSFTVPYWFNVDIRAWQICAVALLSMVMLGYAGYMAATARSLPRRIAVIVPAIVPFAIFLLPHFSDFLMRVHVAGLWLVVALFALSLRTRSFLTAGIMLALCVLFRIWFIFAIPYMIIYFMQNRSWIGWNGIIRFWIALIFTGMAIGGPFFAFEPGAFLANTIGSYETHLITAIDANPMLAHGFGLSGLLYKLNMSIHLMVLALSTQAILLVLLIGRPSTERSVLRQIAVSVLFLSFFALVPFFYLTVPTLILFAFAGTSVTSDEENAIGTISRPTAARMRWSVVAAYVVVQMILIGLCMFGRPKTLPGNFDGMDNLRLDQAFYLQDGFEHAGWVHNLDLWPRQLDAANAYFSIVVNYPRLRHFYLVIDVQNPRPGVVMDVTINGEKLDPPVALDTTGKRWVKWDVPRKNMYFGMNKVSLHVGGQESPLLDEEANAMQVEVWQAQVND